MSEMPPNGLLDVVTGYEAHLSITWTKPDVSRLVLVHLVRSLPYFEMRVRF